MLARKSKRYGRRTIVCAFLDYRVIVNDIENAVGRWNIACWSDDGKFEGYHTYGSIDSNWRKEKAITCQSAAP